MTIFLLLALLQVSISSLDIPLLSSDSLPKEGCKGLGQPPGALYYDNTFLGQTFEEIPAWAVASMSTLLKQSISAILKDYPPTMPTGNYENVGLGASGRAYLFMRLYKNTGNPDYLSIARQYIDTALRYLPKPSLAAVGYLTGNAGVYGVAAMIYSLTGDNTTALHYVDQATTYFLDYVTLQSSGRWVAGIPGLIHLGRTLNLFFEREVISLSLLQNSYVTLYQLGLKYYNTTYGLLQFRPGTYGTWIGVASGTGGGIIELIRNLDLFTLSSSSTINVNVNVNLTEIRKQIEQSLEFYLSRQNKNTGEMWSIYPNRVQWCHGSPGFISLFLQAYYYYYYYYSDTEEDNTVVGEKYLNASILAAKFTAKEGILTKGMLLGHGTAGNIYMAFELYSKTKNIDHLSWAVSMLVQALRIKALTDLNSSDFVSYDCFPGSLFISSTGGMAVLFSDILSRLDNLGDGSLQMPVYGIEW